MHVCTNRQLCIFYTLLFMSQQPPRHAFITVSPEHTRLKPFAISERELFNMLYIHKRALHEASADSERYTPCTVRVRCHTPLAPIARYAIHLYLCSRRQAIGSNGDNQTATATS